MISPKTLNQGESVCIVAPSGEVDQKVVIRNLNTVKSWGLFPQLGKNIFKKFGPFAGTDQERLEDLQIALDNPSIKAIFFARGGFGLIKILDKINFSQFKKDPKWIIGFSDITILHWYINHQLGIQTIHGPVIVNLDNPKSLPSIGIKQILFCNTIEYNLKGNSLNIPGNCIGELVGGNLTTLLSMLGAASTELNLKGKILFIEDIGEYLYHLDRMLYTLIRANWFKELGGLIVGNFSKMKEGRVPLNKNANQIISEALANFNFPVCFDFPAGHIKENSPLILGRKAHLCISNAKEPSLSYIR